MRIKNIFLVDDDDAFLYLTSVFLRKLCPEATIVKAKNGQEALQLLNESRPSILFLDLNMPVMDGWEFLEELNKQNVKVEFPIFITSSSIDPEDRRKASVNVFVNDFVEKPLNPEKIKSIFKNEWAG